MIRGLARTRVRSARTRDGRRAFLLAAVIILLSMATSSPVRAAGGPTRGEGVAVPFEGFTDRNGGPTSIGGAVGVDLVLGSTSRPYLPCQNYDPRARTGDAFVNACQERGSYTTYSRFPPGGGLLFPAGYFMGNSQPDLVRGGLLRTGWGARTAGLSFEFYPDQAHDAEIVHSRFYIDRFDHWTHGWTYSVAIGRIALTALGDPGTARISGQLTDRGRPPAPGRVRIVIFGGHARSSTGYPISSFAVRTSTGSSDWSSGALYAGPQRITVTDTATHRECVLERPRVLGPDSRIDLDLSRPGFGQPGSTCTP
ncbi:hypothetical protein ThrDRAFT_00672 [Frankia casuarinae]|uniref:Uncharacterized protein n=3 Tax=Frankia TaxID=1854 RepID=Q2JGL2_FRACC|nr:hypothetical protein Francci3_0189 [Frankia casuarinae]ETA03721.1 hypothetical protein CcI6DRAFT_00878 [Frankia sp. CcI6]KDA43830.1 hypothetical protein BMG523Draft_01212 [Frankia sp. BMG5.23]OHV57012.1 hypothetical protein CgIS1_08210 [Frankia sp. CgIS1]TFE31172.1 hypothetical protein E0F15_10430 [Frankia sp. B2]